MINRGAILVAHCTSKRYGLPSRGRTASAYCLLCTWGMKFLVIVFMLLPTPSYAIFCKNIFTDGQLHPAFENHLTPAKKAFEKLIMELQTRSPSRHTDRIFTAINERDYKLAAFVGPADIFKFLSEVGEKPTGIRSPILRSAGRLMAFLVVWTTVYETIFGGHQPGYWWSDAAWWGPTLMFVLGNFAKEWKEDQFMNEDAYIREMKSYLTGEKILPEDQPIVYSAWTNQGRNGAGLALSKHNGLYSLYVIQW